MIKGEIAQRRRVETGGGRRVWHRVVAQSGVSGGLAWGRCLRKPRAPRKNLKGEETGLRAELEMQGEGDVPGTETTM